jgi:hypothetical protein
LLAWFFLKVSLRDLLGQCCEGGGGEEVIAASIVVWKIIPVNSLRNQKRNQLGP